jgi:hypothetical protein
MYHEFLIAITGHTFEDNDAKKCDAARYYAKFFVSCIQYAIRHDLPAELFSTPEGIDSVLSVGRIVEISTEVAHVLRSKHDVSLGGKHGLIQHLIQASFLSCQCLELHDLAARQLLFALLGWMTMLYSPEINFSSPTFEIGSDGATCFTKTIQTTAQGNRRLTALLSGFGKVLPWKEEAPAVSQLGDSALLVSSLNAITLLKVGNIKIKWIFSLSAHLDFDEKERELSMFCLPSFCEICCNDNTAFQK